MSWDNITQKLHLKDGIFFTDVQSEISYPPEGNDAYFKVEDRSFWFAHRAQCITEVIKNFPSEGIIFDVGGGNGHVSSVLNKNGLETALVEPNLSGVLNAKQRGLQHLICGTIDSDSLPKNSLPAIGIFDVLEHIPEDSKFLTSIRDMLKPNGMIYITVPAYQSLWSADDDYAGHCRRYSLKRLKTLLENTGFKVSYATYIFSLLPISILFFRTIPYVLGFKKKSSAKEINNDHVIGNKFLNKIIEQVFQWEIGFIRNKKRIFFGSTCLVAARVVK
jgi:SAM-dependent methyltransferase